MTVKVFCDGNYTAFKCGISIEHPHITVTNEQNGAELHFCSAPCCINTLIAMHDLRTDPHPRFYEKEK